MSLCFYTLYDVCVDACVRSFSLPGSISPRSRSEFHRNFNPCGPKAFQVTPLVCCRFERFHCHAAGRTIKTPLTLMRVPLGRFGVERCLEVSPSRWRACSTERLRRRRGGAQGRSGTPATGHDRELRPVVVVAVVCCHWRICHSCKIYNSVLLNCTIVRLSPE